MKKRILQAVRDCWYLPVFEHTTMKTLFKRILTIYNVLDVFELDSNSTIALYGRNSYNWIAIYIACLLKGVNLLVIHPKMNKLETVHILLLTNTNHIFIDPDLVSDDLGKALFVQTLISTEDLSVIFERNNSTNYETLAEILVSSEKNMNVDIKILDTFDEDDDGAVITATSGTEYGEPKWVESHHSSIGAFLTKAIVAVPFKEMNKVYSNVEFAESHFLTVLLPFVKGCILVGSKDQAEVVIEDTNSIESVWRNEVNYLYSKRVYSFLFSITWMKWLFKKIALLKMKSYYGKKLEALVVYNSTIHEEILSTLIGKFPIYTTYGSQETNQLVAINDFSTKVKRMPFAVGTALQNIFLNTTNEEELEISGTTLFERYVGDDSYTREVRYRDNYLTGDIGVTDPKSNVLFVYGRKKAIILNDFKLPVQLDKIERIIKSIPYIQEVIILLRRSIDQEERTVDKLILLVYPDINFVEAKGLGILHTESLMEIYRKKINQALDQPIQIDTVILMTESFLKTHDGKICRYYYS
jgi:long-subunit acyl-CoA synthetase (AMP-forming)